MKLIKDQKRLNKIKELNLSIDKFEKQNPTYWYLKFWKKNN